MKLDDNQLLFVLNQILKETPQLLLIKIITNLIKVILNPKTEHMNKIKQKVN